MTGSPQNPDTYFSVMNFTEVFVLISNIFLASVNHFFRNETSVGFIEIFLRTALISLPSVSYFTRVKNRAGEDLFSGDIEVELSLLRWSRYHLKFFRRQRSIVLDNLGRS